MSQDKKAEIFSGESPAIDTPQDPLGLAVIQQQKESTFSGTSESLRSFKQEIENRLKKSISPEERAHYSAILEKFRTVFDEKTTQATKDTKNNLTSFISGLSLNEKALAEKVKQSVPVDIRNLGLEAERLASQAASTVDTSGKKILTQTAEAIKSGDVSKAGALIEGVQDTINAAGQKMREYTGSAAFKKILEPISENGIAGIFAVLANLLKFLTNGFKFSDILDEGKKKAEGAVDSGKEKLDALKTKAESTFGEIKDLSPEKRSEIVGKMADSLAGDISTRYLGGAKLSPEKIGKLKEIILSTDINPEKLQELVQRIDKKQEITIENLVQFLGISFAGTTELMWKIAFSGMIPLKDIAYEAVMNGSKTAVGLTLAGLGLPPMVLSVEELNAVIAKYGSASGEKEMALIQLQFYRPLGVFWAITSGIVAKLAETGIAIGADTASGANGFTVAKGLTGIQGKNYGSVFEEFEKINKQFTAFSAPSGSSVEFDQVLSDLKTSVNTTTKNWRVISLLQEVEFDYAKLISHPQISTVLDPSEIEKLKSAKNPQSVIREIVKPPNTLGELKNLSGRFFGSSKGIMQRYLRDMAEVQRFQNLLVSSDKNGLEKLLRLGHYVNTLKVIRRADVVSLHLENADDVKNFQALRKLLATFPEGIRGLGSILPAGAFVVTMSSAVSNDASTEEIETALMAVLVPLVGGYQLVKNFGISFEDLKQGKMPTLGEGAATVFGGTILFFEGARLLAGGGKALGHFTSGEILQGTKTLGRTAFMHPLDIAKSVGYITRGSVHITKAAPAIYSQFAKTIMRLAPRIPKKGYAAIAAGVLMGTAYAASHLQEKDHLELQEELKKDGILDSSGNLSQKFYTEFEMKSNEEKGTMVTDLFGALVDTTEKNPKVRFDATRSEFVVVVKKKEEKSTWQDLLQTDTLFRDQLMSMGIDVYVIAEDEFPKIVKSNEKLVPKL